MVDSEVRAVQSVEVAVFVLSLAATAQLLSCCPDNKSTRVHLFDSTQLVDVVTLCA